MVATTGMNSSASRPSRIAGLIAVDVADEPELGVAGDGLDQPGVLAADADRVVAVEVDGRHELRVDLPDQHHAGDVDGLGVGDPQAVAELGGLAEAIASASLICGPPPCTTTGRRPTRRISTMSSANTSRAS